MYILLRIFKFISQQNGEKGHVVHALLQPACCSWIKYNTNSKQEKFSLSSF